jgi:hypothetical protein
MKVSFSHFSAITLLGIPADVYKFGASYWLTCISIMLVSLVAVCVYLPVLFRLQLVNTYEYLERRFDRKTKLLASFLYILGETLFNSIVAYTPSLALAAGEYQSHSDQQLKNQSFSNWHRHPFNRFCNLCHLHLLHINRGHENCSLDRLLSIGSNSGNSYSSLCCWCPINRSFFFNLEQSPRGTAT